MTESTEAERSILEACLIDNRSIPDLTPEDFDNPRDRIIFGAILEMQANGDPIDLVTLKNHLGSDLEKAGGITYLAGLVSGGAAVRNIQAYVKIVREASALRLLEDDVRRVSRMINDGADGKAILYQLELASSKMRQKLQVGDGPKKIGEFLKPILSEVEAQANGTDTGKILTGFTILDQMSGGFKAGEVIIVAAKEKLGKSSFAMNIACNVAGKQKKPVLFVSLEMANQEIAKRALFSYARLNHMRASQGFQEEEWSKLGEAFGEVKDLPVWLDDSSSTPNAVKSAAKKLQDNGGLGLIVVDYLQLLSPDSKKENRTQEVASISRALKLMAMDLQVPVIALSQLSRAPKDRKDKRPRMEDLKESGSISQDATMVILLHRDDDKINTSRTDVDVAANRNGPSGPFYLDFDRETTTFMNAIENE